MVKNSQESKIKNLSIGLPKIMNYGNGNEIESGIGKEPIEEAYLTKKGFKGDGVADLRYHGGLDRAVCIYPYEHYLLWKDEFKNPLNIPTFGENLTVTNMLEKDVYIGDIYRLGEAIIQITQGRIPCSTITKRTSNPLLLKRMIQKGYTGFLARVIEEGNVNKNSKITLIDSHPKQVSILYANNIYYHNRTDANGIRRILDVKELASEWKDLLLNQLNKLSTLG